MYRLKYYYKNGTTQLSENSYNDIAKYDGEIRQLTKNDDFNPTENDRKDFTKYLKLALKDNEDKKGPIYRIDVIDDKTREIIAYKDDSEAFIDGKKGHVTYDPDTLEINGTMIDDKCKKGIYSFKFYYIDGTTKISNVKTNTPEELYEDFDGLIEWEELDNFYGRTVTTKEVLETATRAYKGFLPDFYRIEIVNTKTNEVVDYIDLKEVKKNG